MSAAADVAGLYSAIEDSARLLDVPCARETVWPILTAYEDSLARAVVAFRVATGARNAGELDCRFMMLPGNVDPLARAWAHGLVERSGHPADVLLTDIGARFPIDCYGIDFGVVGGFKKTWSFFPADDMQELSSLAELASMPRALADNLEFFARHGLDDKASLIGIDHRSRTVNIYFGTPPADCFLPSTMRTMLRDIGLPEPSGQMLRLGREAFGVYVTLSWESTRVERICFAVMTPDPMSLPVRIDPRIERFVAKAPHDTGDRRFVYAVASSAAGEYHKLQSYLRWRPQMLGVMLLDDQAGAVG